MSRLPQVLRGALDLLAVLALVYVEFVWLGVIPSPWSPQ